MFKSLSKTVLAAAAACTLGVAHADVLNFDDLGNGFQFFTSDYHGFRFGTNNIQTTAWIWTSSFAPTVYLPHSGNNFVGTDNTLYNINNLWEATQPITSTTPFKFDGAWFAGYDQVRFELYLGGTLVATSADSAQLAATPQWLSSGYTGLVDSVVVVGHQGYYAMDDFTFNTPVPEPTTYGLMAAGLLAVAAIARRRRA